MKPDPEQLKAAVKDALCIGAVAASKKHKQTVHRIRTYAIKQGLKLPSEQPLQKQRTSRHYKRAITISETQGVKAASEQTGIAPGTIYRIMKRIGRKYHIPKKRMGRNQDLPHDWTPENVPELIRARVSGKQLQAWVASVVLNDMDPEYAPEPFIELVTAYIPNNSLTDTDLAAGLEAIGYPNANARAHKGVPSNYKTVNNGVRKSGWHNSGSRIRLKRRSRAEGVADGWEAMGWGE